MADPGRADPVSFTESLDFDDEDIEYLPSEEAVRYVAEWVRPKSGSGTPDRPPEKEPFYRTVTAEEWAEMKGPEIGANRVRTIVADRLDIDPRDVDVGARAERLEPTVVVRYIVVHYIVVHCVTGLGATGEETKPAASYEDVVEATPQSVTITVTFLDQRHTRTLPVEVAERGPMRPA